MPECRIVRRTLGFATALAIMAAGLNAVLPSGQAAAASGVVFQDGFEAGTGKWFAGPENASMSRFAGGHSGHAVRVVNTGNSRRTTVMNDRVNSVGRTVTGTTYTATAMVRTANPPASVNLRLMEWDGRVAGEGNSDVWLTDTKWHRLYVSHTAGSSTASIDLNVLAWNLAAQGSFDVDSVRMMAQRDNASTSAPALPSTTPTAPRAGRSAPVGAATATPARRSLVWADEFTGTTVDAGKWKVRNNSYASNEESCVTNRPSNVAVSDGVLKLTAQRESYVCGSTLKAFTSGYLDTIDKASWTYGTFEMRAKLPTQPNTSKGLWPAFWMRPDGGGNGEIDIMEAIGSAAGETEFDKSHETIWYDYKKTHASEPKSSTLPKNAQPSNGFHVYRLDWGEAGMTWYIDGVEVYQRSPSTTKWYSEVFNKAYNIRLNLQVGGSWAGSPNGDTDFSKSFEVDYVRVYQ